jgi:D-threo-aldose 1-dehydrogenase
VQRITYQAADEARLAPVKRIEAVCERHSAEVGAAALQFSMRDSRVSATRVGVSRPERVEQTLSWANASLGEAVLAELGGLDYESTDPEAERRYTPG